MSLKAIFCLYCPTLCAAIVGNPCLPSMFSTGIISEVGSQNIYVRGGYVADFVYHMRFDDEFPTIESSSEKITMVNYSSLISANLYQRVDLYTLLGTMQMTIKDTMNFSREFLWAVGAKAILYQGYDCCLGIDGKYLSSQQKALFLLIDELPASLRTNFFLDYTEWQIALSFNYTWNYLAPYAGLAYLHARASPASPLGFFTLSAWDMNGEFDAVNIVNRKHWGIILGLTIFSDEAATLNIEGRALDQYSVNLQGEIAF